MGAQNNSDGDAAESATEALNPLDAAFGYAEAGLPVFPCRWHGEGRKSPLTRHGLRDASTDPAVIAGWWRRWPNALIGMATGLRSGRVVLDIDQKNGVDGFASLAELGFAVLPATVLVRTPSGGLHLHFDPAGQRIPTTQGAHGRGIGPGLDWRAEGGYVILPAPGSGYCWERRGPLLPVPDLLLPKPLADAPPAQEVEDIASARCARLKEATTTIAIDNDRAITRACLAIRGAPNGSQERTLHRQGFLLGGLAGAGGVAADIALNRLIHAALGIPNYDPNRPWHRQELVRKVKRSFNRGFKRPRVPGNQ